MTKADMLTLPLKYESQYANGREREVAMYIDGKYLARGPAHTARQACCSGWGGGWGGWYEMISPSRITWELDSWNGRRGDDDREYLCWGSGIYLSCAEMLDWLSR